MKFGTIAVELVIGFILLFIITKILGKKQISQVTPFDFISALVLGEIVGSAVFEKEISMWHMLFAITIWGLLIFISELIELKFKGARKFLEGQPSILIRNGKLQRHVLKENQLDMNQLLHMLRTKDAFSIREVEYAILEANGDVTVLKKSPYQSPVRNDLNLPQQPVPLPVSLIIDGELIRDNLINLNKDESWLKRQLEAHSVKDYTEVFYADYKDGEGLFVDKMGQG